MTLVRLAIRSAAGPKLMQHYSYDDNVDTPAKLIEDEATEFEHEVPADENESIEGQIEEEKHEPPAFEE